MIRWIRVVLPSGRWVNAVLGIVACLFLIIEVAYRIFFYTYGVRLSGEFAEDLSGIHHDMLAVVLVAAAVAYGVFRGAGFHPLFRSRYYEWLTSVPWTAQKPLPLGPTHLVPQDIVVVLTLTLLMSYGIGLQWFVMPLAALLPYLACLALAHGFTREWVAFYSMTFGVGLLFYFWQQPFAVYGICVPLYAVAYVGLRRSLARFPWNTEEGGWQPADIVVAGEQRNEPLVRFLHSVQQSSGRKTAQIYSWRGWPLDNLHPPESIEEISWAHGVLLSFLTGWILFSLNGIEYVEDWDYGSVVFLRAATAIAALLRVAVYCNGYSPPISLFGRIFTLRWIIPGYDKVLLAPLLAVVTSFVVPDVLRHFGCPLKLAVPLSASLVLMVLTLVGPKLRHWRLTGHHRLSLAWIPATRECTKI